MSGPVIPYTPAASTAWGQAFAAHAVTFNDPVDTAYPSADPDRVDAQFFLNQVQCEILRLQQIAFAGGGAIQVRNASGSTLNNGPVRVTGYYQDDSSSTGTGNPIFTIVAADAATNTYANALLLTSLANATTGVAYVMGDFTPSPALDLSGGSVGDPVYLAAGGGMTRTAPSGADQMVQVIGQIKTNAVTGVVAGFVQMPKVFGTSWHQNKSITAALVASGAASSGQALIADGSGGAAFSGTVSVPSGGTGAATLGTSKQPLLGNGTGAVTASAAPTTNDTNADAIAGTSATTKKALVLQGKASQAANIFEIQDSTGVTKFAISLGSATVSGANNTNLGANAGTAETLGSNNTNVGVNAGSGITSGSYNTFVGSLAGSGTVAASENVAIGENAFNTAAGANDKQNVVVGKDAAKNANGSATGANTVLGYAAAPTLTTGASNIILGANADVNSASAANNFVAGSPTNPVADVYFGKGMQNSASTPGSDWTLHGNGGGGTTNNQAGGNVILAGGAGTGNAEPGVCALKFPLKAASGTTLESLSTQKFPLGGAMFTTTATTTVSAATVGTTETTLVGSVVGSQSLEGGLLRAGRQVHLRLCGRYNATNVPTTNFKVKIGSVVITSTSAITLPNQTNLFIEIDVFMTCQTVGASGTVQCSGRFLYAPSVLTAPIVVPLDGSATVDTTSTANVDCTVTYSANTASNSIVISGVCCEVKN